MRTGAARASLAQDGCLGVRTRRLPAADLRIARSREGEGERQERREGEARPGIKGEVAAAAAAAVAAVVAEAVAAAVAAAVVTSAAAVAAALAAATVAAVVVVAAASLAAPRPLKRLRSCIQPTVYPRMQQLAIPAAERK